MQTHGCSRIREPVKRKIDSLLDKLSDEKRFKQYYQAYVSSEVPELWEDATSRDAFESSFFEWLAASSSGRRRPKAAVHILDALGMYDATMAESIRAKLEERLECPDWYENEFRRVEK